jgi:L-lysine 2,3-aminomutase
MNTNQILSAIDAAISKLQQARALLSGYSEPVGIKRVPGGQKKSFSPTPVVAKRTMSAEGKARIVAAQKKRWAASKKAAKQVV